MLPNLTFIYDRKGQASKERPGVVELRIGSGKARKYISTGVRVYPKEWSNGSIVGRKDWKELNDQLQTLKRKCSEIINKMMEDNNLDIEAIPRLLNTSIMQQITFLEYIKGLGRTRFVKIAAGTKKHYLTFFNFMESWKGIVSFADVTESNIMKMDEYLADRGLKESSRYNYHKLLKSFILRAVNEGLIKRNPYVNLSIKRGDENGSGRFLTPDEFHKLEKCIIPIEKLRKVRDLFVFQTYTCLSYSDLAEFDYKKCVKVEGQVIYKGNRHKTGQEFTTVLLKPALTILKHYRYKLPVLSNQKYNDYLKAAVMYAKIGKQVTSHWARHTGATLLLNDGNVPMHIVQHILGHATIRETERTYAKVLDKTIVRSMKEYEKKKFG